MTEPLDFSSTGSKKRAPSPQGASKRPLGSGWPKARTAVVVAVALVAIAGFVLFGRGGPNGQAGGAATVARYCELAMGFDRLAPDTAPGAGPVDTSASAISRLLLQMGGTLAEMKVAAPAEIRPDVAATVKALQEAAKGNPAGIRAASFQAHRQRIDSLRQKMCPAGVGNGD